MYACSPFVWLTVGCAYRPVPSQSVACASAPRWPMSWRAAMCYGTFAETLRRVCRMRTAPLMRMSDKGER